MNLKINPQKLELWEMELLEGGKMSDIILVYCQYLAGDDDKLLSPDLPCMPFDEMSDDELAQMKASKAYKAMRRFTVPELKQANQEVINGFKDMFQ